MIKAERKPHLIYDVGMHKGEDTDFYLKKGFKVIGFEANPQLVVNCKKRFEQEIVNGDLVIVEGAIVNFGENKKSPSSVKFYVNKDKTIWGTAVKDWALRNEHLGTSNEVIEVPAINFSQCLKKYGIPYYLKIDIEGCDRICLESLLNFDQKPNYISIESEKRKFKLLEEEFKLLNQLGYTSFKAINQARVLKQKEPQHREVEGHFLGYTFSFGSTGLFGNDLPDKWKTEKQVLKQYRKIFIWYRLFGDYGKLKKTIVGRGFLKLIRRLLPLFFEIRWYDTHAKHLSQ